MHVQRVHYGKLSALVLVVMGLLLLLYRSLPDPRTSFIDVEVEDGYVEVAQVGQEAAKSSEEALAVAKFHACPACLGRGLCQEVSQGWLTVSVFGKPVAGGGTEYLGSLKEEDWRLAVTVAGDGAWDSWDASVCANASQPRGCLVSEAASRSFLFRGRADGPGLRRLHRLTGAASPPPLTACANSELSHQLAEAFDENRDGQLSAEERSVLVSTVGVAPGMASLRLAASLGMRGIPSFLGACGRLVVTEGGLTPLDQYLQSEWETRRDLGLQVFSLLESLVTPESDWLWILWHLDLSSFSVTRTGQVVLSSLDNITPVARALLGKPPQEERQPCNLNCFLEWKQEVLMATPRGQPGKGCAHARHYADLAFSLACSSVLGGPRGLLKNSGEEIRELLERCSTENQPGARYAAVDQLIGLLNGDEGSGDEDGAVAVEQDDGQEDEEEEDEDDEDEEEDDDEEEDHIEDDLETKGLARKERNVQDGHYTEEDEEDKELEEEEEEEDENE